MAACGRLVQKNNAEQSHSLRDGSAMCRRPGGREAANVGVTRSAQLHAVDAGLPCAISSMTLASGFVGVRRGRRSGAGECAFPLPRGIGMRGGGSMPPRGSKEERTRFLGREVGRSGRGARGRLYRTCVQESREEESSGYRIGVMAGGARAVACCIDRGHGKHSFGDMVYALCRMGILESRRPICPGKRSRSWLNEQILSNWRCEMTPT